MEFEPTILAGERPHTYALDRAATGTGMAVHYEKKTHFKYIVIVFLWYSSNVFKYLNAWNIVN
jgi:hypothetical protein